MCEEGRICVPCITIQTAGAAGKAHTLLALDLRFSRPDHVAISEAESDLSLRVFIQFMAQTSLQINEYVAHARALLRHLLQESERLSVEV